MIQRVLSPVDYDAASRGYMPPSEHLLIDELQFRGARVSFSSGIDPDATWWLVTKGGARCALSKIGLRLFSLMAEWERDAVRHRAPAACPWRREDLAAMFSPPPEEQSL